MKHFRDWNFATKQSVLILALLAVVGVGINYTVRREVRKIMGREITRAAGTAVQLSAERMDRHFIAVQSAARELAIALETLRPGEEAQERLLQTTFVRLRKQVPALCGISIAYEPFTFGPTRRHAMIYVMENSAGEVEISRPGGPDYQYEFFNWFTIPRALGHGIWTEPYFDTFARRQMTTWSQPIQGADGSFLGISGFDLSLEGLGDLVEQADAFGYGEEFLLSRFGRFMACPGGSDGKLGVRPYHSTIFSFADALGGNMFSSEDTAARIRRLGQEMIAGRTGDLRINMLDTREGKAEWLFYAPVPLPGWSIGVIYPEALLMEPLARLEWLIRAISVAGVLVVLVVVVAVSRRLSRPLERLTRAAQSIGSGNFETELPASRSGDEIGRLGAAFGAMQRELIHYIEQLKKTVEARQKIEGELRAAREIQQGILPKMVAPLPDAEQFALFAELRPARAVGGDLYDFFALDDHRYVLIIGDVSGKGIPAALFMAMTQTLQRSEVEKYHHTGKLVGRINNLLNRSNESLMFVSYFVGVLDIRTGTMEYTNAGHTPAYLVRRDGVLEQLNTRHGPVLGVMPDREYGHSTVTLRPGDLLVLYTDGVTEAMDADQREFGAEALQRVLAGTAGMAPDRVGEEILEAVAHFVGDTEQADDITALILQFKAKLESGSPGEGNAPPL